MLISRANIEDHSTLTKITIQSKAHWGYSAEQMKLWTNDLTITPDYIEKNDVYNLVVDDEIIAYYSIHRTAKDEVLLDNLFISPTHIGKGFGRLLLNDFLDRMKAKGVSEVKLYSDPHSEDFYRHFGFEVIGKMETSITGRFLPIMKRSL